MNKWTLKSLVAAAVGVLAFAGSANAAISYTYSTDATNYDLNPGQTKTIKLYLLETLTAPSTSLITADQGLFSGSVRVARTAGTSTLGAIGLNVVDFLGPTNSATTPIEASFQEAVGLNDTKGAALNNTGGTAANAKANGIFLGTLDITAGPAAGVSTFTLRRYDPTRIGNTFTYTNFYDMDVDNANPAFTGTSNAAVLASEQFTVTVVPEPTSAGVAVILSAAGTLIRRRRQQA